MRFMTLPEAAQTLNISTRTLRRLRLEGGPLFHAVTAEKGQGRHKHTVIDTTAIRTLLRAWKTEEQEKARAAKQAQKARLARQKARSRKMAGATCG